MHELAVAMYTTHTIRCEAQRHSMNCHRMRCRRLPAAASGAAHCVAAAVAPWTAATNAACTAQLLHAPSAALVETKPRREARSGSDSDERPVAVCGVRDDARARPSESLHTGS